MGEGVQYATLIREVETPKGKVRIAIGCKSHPMTQLDFKYQGRHYTRTFHGKTYLPPGVIRKARAFVEEITEYVQR